MKKVYQKVYQFIGIPDPKNVIILGVDPSSEAGTKKASCAKGEVNYSR